MEYRNLGRSGLKVSVLSYGSWVTFSTQVDDSLAIKCMKTAYDAGINFFDNAEVYADGQSEIIMGRALKALDWSRDSYIVSSKVFWGGSKPTQKGLSRKHVHDACHAAMKRLQVDYLDLYFCHRPDPETPIEETVRAMNTLIEQGKVLYWGTSEWSAEQIKEAYKVAQEHHLIAPTMEQPEYNMFNRQRFEVEYAPLFKDYGLGSTIWSPLASGILTGKYNQGIPQDSRMSLKDFAWLRERFESDVGRKRVQKVGELSKIAKELGMSMAQLAIGWCLKNPHVSSVILGASKIDQLIENISALEMMGRLDEGSMKQIKTILDF